ncbi:MAG: copper resistance protein CopC, partial [Chloroflexota bacterium]
MKYTRQLLLFVLLVATAALWLGRPAPPVLAHANLVTADPAPNTVLEQSPPQVVIRFTEPLEPEFSAIQVLDVLGQGVDSGDSRQDTNDPTVLIVSLPPLPDGTYTVVWK